MRLFITDKISDTGMKGKKGIFQLPLSRLLSITLGFCFGAYGQTRHACGSVMQRLFAS